MNKQRNVSIDLLRIFAMLMIVIWHSTNHGSLATLSNKFDCFNIWVHMLQSLTCVAVDVYVLISGYFLCTQAFSFSRLVKIWIQVFFYSILLLLFCLIFDIADLGITDVPYFLLPISYRTNWFVTSYIGLCLLSPILNKLINSINKKQHFGIVCFLLCVTSIWHDLLPMSFGFDIYDGKRVTWFIVLYFIASYVRKYIETSKIPSRKCFVVYLVSCSLQLLVWIIIYLAGNALDLNNQVLQYACDYYYFYGSCFTVFSATMLFLSFLGLKINSTKISKCIIAIAPLTFGVYLIHDNPYLREFIWKSIKELSETNLYTVLYSLTFCLTIFVVCLLLDYLRSLLFMPLYKSSRWKMMIKRIDEKFYALYNRIISLV